DLAEERDNTTLKIIVGEDTYVLIEALNMIDNGRLLKSLVAGMTSGGKANQKQSGLVSRLMEAYEESRKEPSFYENLQTRKTDRSISDDARSPEEETPLASKSGDDKKSKS
uniref:hypothetical protein n=1 Tax=Salmonella sp. s51884 TaxID=3159654 RepID=UPI00397F6EDE